MNDDLCLATSVDDKHKAKKEGKIAIVLGFQDTKPIEDDVSHLMTFSDFGIRIVQLTYNSQNLVGVGCARGLVARGYSDREVLGVLGGNFLRVFRRVWK